MSASPRLTDRSLSSLFCVLALAALGLDLSAQDSFHPPRYIHNIYYACGRPALIRRGKCVYDSSSRERMDQILGELAALGVNAVTFHSAYRAEGAAYDPRHPALKRSHRWPKHMHPVKNFLDLCRKYGMAGYLAVYLGSPGGGYNQDPRMAELVEDDILDVFGKHPAFKGFVPPIEASPTLGIDTDSFIALSKRVRDRRPDLKIMDYPNGLFGGHIVQTVIRRSLSGYVDIENIQFHSADEKLTGFLEARGLTLFTIGACPGIKSIVHTHYKYGVGKQWLPPHDAYKVSQGATVTATAHGTSIFSFLHGFWGSDVPGDTDALWRRVEWYKGILNTQRMAPFLAEAENMASVAIMIPYHSFKGALDQLRMTYDPLAEAHIPVAHFVNRKNFPSRTRLVLAPFLSTCSEEQLGLLAELTKKGGTLVVVSEAERRREIPADLSPHALRVLGIGRAQCDTSKLDAQFVKQIRLGKIEPIEGPIRSEYGKGTIIVVPGTTAWVAEHLAKVISGAVPDMLPVRNLPKGYIVEHWRTKGGTEFLLFLATETGQRAANVSVQLGKGAEQLCLIMPDGVQANLPPSDDGSVVIPEIGDEFAILVLGRHDVPILVPQSRVTRCKTSDTLTAACSILNPLPRPISGKIALTAPTGWHIKDAVSDIAVEPGQTKKAQFAVRVPKDAERKPHFLRFECMGLVQRAVVFPEDGTPQVITELKEVPPEWNPPRRPPGTKPRPRPTQVGTEWMSVTAGPDDNNAAAHMPGVCFLPGREWDSPADFEGKVCRYGETVPIQAGGPNFLVNGPALKVDLQLRITYWTKAPGIVQVFDGKKYHRVARLDETGRWAEVEFDVSRDLFGVPEADRRNYSGFNVMFEVRSPGVRVHRISVRRKERK